MMSDVEYYGRVRRCANAIVESFLEETRDVFEMPNHIANHFFVEIFWMEVMKEFGNFQFWPKNFFPGRDFQTAIDEITSCAFDLLSKRQPLKPRGVT